METCSAQKIRSGVCRALPLFLFAGMLAVLPAGCSKEQKAAGQGAPEVGIMVVEEKDIPVFPEYVAQTQSSRQVNIHARVSGFLEKRVYTEGAIVKEGDTLFLMDQKPFQVQLDQARAVLARQEAARLTAAAESEAHQAPCCGQCCFTEGSGRCDRPVRLCLGSG